MENPSSSRAAAAERDATFAAAAAGTATFAARATKARTGNHTLDWVFEGADGGDPMLEQLFMVARVVGVFANCIAFDLVAALLWLLVRPFSRARARACIARFAQAPWCDATLALFPKPQIVLSGELPHPARPGIIIANHQVAEGRHARSRGTVVVDGRAQPPRHATSAGCGRAPPPRVERAAGAASTPVARPHVPPRSARMALARR